jgi:hypothetical protein
VSCSASPPPRRGAKFLKIAATAFQSVGPGLEEALLILPDHQDPAAVRKTLALPSTQKHSSLGFGFFAQFPCRKILYPPGAVVCCIRLEYQVPPTTPSGRMRSAAGSRPGPSPPPRGTTATAGAAFFITL